MKAGLKTLPDKLRGGAWPSPVRTVRCPAKPGNERDPRRQLLEDFARNPKETVGTAAVRRRKERATAGQYALNPRGHTRDAMARTMGSDPERERQSRNRASVGIEGCNPSS
jgi:hypothetical protein